ncbi:SDR family oxidoreductase [Mycolicibacterium setense]|uniref:SDR family oxidoreductase n=1 Tax=Mycolicibacterium setense TaxID=431269 RepID=UPI0003A49998|nr:SDR family oxidoreductase [Mycolicibacterium setense]KHO19312.1 oxidoreductase [Mycolicibacterium setense]MCV7113248.1 SDR family oxidoreductase [Mycolicibacterium setense]OBB15266.1 oxidoreductase [Mycolicibacterium setense]
MSGQRADAAGLRLLVVGASSGIGHAVAVGATERGAKVAVAARRIDLLNSLAEATGGYAFELDVEDFAVINQVVNDAADALGGLDAVVFTSTVIPFAHIEDTDVATWLHAFSVNTVGANNVLRAAVPRLSENGVILVASSHDVGRPRAGVAAYSASKAALDEILHSWRSEHPELSLIRVGIGPTDDTEILRGADRDLLDQLLKTWVAQGALPARMSALRDVANTLVSLVTTAYENPTVVPEIVQLAPRIKRRANSAE